MDRWFAREKTNLRVMSRLPTMRSSFSISEYSWTRRVDERESFQVSDRAGGMKGEYEDEKRQRIPYAGRVDEETRRREDEETRRGPESNVWQDCRGTREKFLDEIAGSLSLWQPMRPLFIRQKRKAPTVRRCSRPSSLEIIKQFFSLVNASNLQRKLNDDIWTWHLIINFITCNGTCV